MRAGKLERNRAPIRGVSLRGEPDRRVTAITSRLPPRLYSSGHVGPDEECDMIADWIVIYAVLFVLCAAVVSGVPSKG